MVASGECISVDEVDDTATGGGTDDTVTDSGSVDTATDSGSDDTVVGSGSDDETSDGQSEDDPSTVSGVTTDQPQENTAHTSQPEGTQVNSKEPSMSTVRDTEEAMQLGSEAQQNAERGLYRERVRPSYYPSKERDTNQISDQVWRINQARDPAHVDEQDITVSTTRNEDGSITTTSRDENGNWVKTTRWPGGRPDPDTEGEASEPEPDPNPWPATVTGVPSDSGSGSGTGTRTRTGGGTGTGTGTRPDDDDGDDPRDTPPPVIYGEEIDVDERVGILLRHDEWHWIPRLNGVTFVTAKIYVPDPSRPGIWVPSDSAARVITVKFVRRSNEPGQSMNYDLKFAPEDSPDIYLQKGGDTRCSDDPTGGKGFYGTCETLSAYNEKMFSVRSLDYGSYSRMEATCADCVPLKPIYPYSFIGGYRPGDSFPDAVEAPLVEERLTRVPHDENSNNIADQYELDKLWTGPADDDTEKQPWGNGVVGDGYSAYQEYRGFMDHNLNHKRSSWFKKTLLVDNSTGMSLSQFRNQSGLEVIEIFRDAHKNRVANYNNNFAHLHDQHCLILKRGDPGKGFAGRSYGFGPPKNVEKVVLATAYTSDSNSTVAHELGHATGIRHHGDKSKKVIEVHPHSNILSGLVHTYTHAGVDLCGTFLPAKFDLGPKGDQASGFENCIMRYNYSKDIYQQSNDDFQCHIKGQARLLFCETSSGTGQNAGGRTAGNATVGDCKSQIIVNDN